MIKSYYAEFFTATILNWQKLLHDDKLKLIIVDSLRWLQKLNYIHYNPCQAHWQLAVIPEDYKWSSDLFL